MLTLINKISSTFGFQIIGNGSLKKIRKGEFKKDCFETQKSIAGNKSSIIFDVGANRGDVTQKYNLLFPDSKIFAFEPFPDHAQIFRSNFSLRKNIELHEMALSNIVGTLDFHVNKSSDTNSLLKSTKIGASSDEQCRTQSKITVNVNTLDNFCKERNISNIDILKLDVQGSELNILQGANDLLSQRKIKLIYTEAYFKEQYENQPLFFQICEYLLKRGFYLEDIYNPYYNQQQILWCDALFVHSEI
jgi:FkbM family methyltransferase